MLYFILIVRSDCFVDLNFDNITIHEAYQIAKDILEQENMRNGLDLSINFFGFKSYYTSDFFKNKIKLEK